MAGTASPTVEAAVAGVVSAFCEGVDLVGLIKQKRVHTMWPGPSRLLEDSLQRGSSEILAQAKLGVDRFGKAFHTGDTVAIGDLGKITTELQTTLLRQLSHALEDDSYSLGAAATDASDSGRVRTIVVLSELYFRLAQKAMSETHPPMPRRESSNAPEAVPVQSISQRRQSRPMRRQSSNTSKTPATPPPADLSPSYLPQLSWLKKKKTKGRSDSTTSPPLMEGVESPDPLATPILMPTVPLGAQRSFSSSNRDYTGQIGNKKPLSSEQNPYLSLQEFNVFSATPRSSSPRRAPSDDAESLLTLPVRISTSTSRTLLNTRAQGSLLRIPSAENDYLGFCKGAWALQRGDEKAFKEQKEMAFGKVSYLMCAHCAFTGRISRTKVWDTDGVRFRWAFLAKNHVHQTRVKRNVHAYVCMFCAFQGVETGVIQSDDAFIRHVAEHRGEEFSEALLDRTRCVNHQLCTDDEDFDVNLVPPSFETERKRQQSKILPDDWMDPVLYKENSWTPQAPRLATVELPSNSPVEAPTELSPVEAPTDPPEHLAENASDPVPWPYFRS